MAELHPYAVTGTEEEAKGKYQIYPQRPQRKINCFTATYTHEGIRIIADCLSRQTLKDFNWIVVDKHWDMKWFNEKILPYGLDIIYLPEKARYPQKFSGWNNARNTGKIFFDAELIVELEDYIWFRPDCLERFFHIYDKCNNSVVSAVFSRCLYSSYEKAFGKEILTDSDVEVFDPTVRPRDQGVVATSILPYVDISNQYVGFEGNISSYPLSIIRNCPELWDEEMDDALGFNNFQVAVEAMLLDYYILMDSDTKYYYFEHKDIGSGAWEWSSRNCRNNEDYFRKKYLPRIEMWIMTKIYKKEVRGVQL